MFIIHLYLHFLCSCFLSGFYTQLYDIKYFYLIQIQLYNFKYPYLMVIYA